MTQAKPKTLTFEEFIAWKPENGRYELHDLVVEVVSTNWRDDYYRKFGEFEAIGIPEYWIVDYLGLGGKRFTSNPKQPTFSICYLVNGEYQISQFRGDDRIQSPTFPELNLTAVQMFQTT